MGGPGAGGPPSQSTSTPRKRGECLARVQTVRARLKTRSEALQAYADWLYDRLAQSAKVGFVLHAANVRKNMLIAEWEAAHKRLLSFKESTEEIQFTFRQLQKNLDEVEKKVLELETMKNRPRSEFENADDVVAILADLREADRELASTTPDVTGIEVAKPFGGSEAAVGEQNLFDD